MLVLKKENHITGDDIFGVNGLVWGHDGLIMDFFGELTEQGEDKVKKKNLQGQYIKSTSRLNQTH